ncbi:MAG: lipid kinase [Actinomycetota bacterium]|nr:lipid kinase [Actinomycetota bacterium]
MIDETATTNPGEKGVDRLDWRTRRPPFERTNFRRAALVVNTRSRVGEPAFSLALSYLTASGIPIDAVYALRDPARLAETVREALLEGHDLVILGGGDGSLSTVVDLLAKSDAMLGLLPLGTANDFARTLGIPFDLEAACNIIAHGKVVNADLGLAGSNYYVNVASVGLGTEVVENLSPRLKRTTKALAYPIAAVRAYANHRPFSVALGFPDGDHEPADLEGLLQVAVGNGRCYGGGMVVAPDSGIDDAALDVYAIAAGKGLELARVVRGLWTGEFVESPCVRYWRTPRVHIQTDHRLSINVDGELVSRTPKTFSVAPKALKVLVPEAYWRAETDEASAAREPILSR